jgi:multicomponent Na+:H+ antiporter subunit G
MDILITLWTTIEPYWHFVRDVLILLGLLFGIIFSIIGGIGFLRLPDAYTRLHVTGKVSVFALFFFLIASGFAIEGGFFRSFILLVLMIIGAPSVSHSIASAAYKAGIALYKPARDDLAAKIERGSGEDV